VTRELAWSSDRVLIAPSILSANFAELGLDIAAVERGGADLIHIDVMDGHFVPNITIGQPVVRAIKRIAACPLDVHLMIEEADRYVDDFVDAGADLLSVHVEVTPHLHRTIAHIKSRGVKAGAVLNPSTPVSSLLEVASDLDFVLVMSVNPGFSGQTFIRQGLDKVRRVRDILTKARSSALIEIDGGIDTSNAREAVDAGATILVAGNAIFGAANAETATHTLRAAADAASRR
jgi:ribulose-phosphate 3-epimerase